ncbi:MAG: ATP-binding protein [Patescibacteria group bacterium]
MTLGNKINFVLITTVTVILAGAFWIITDLESRSIKQQINSDAGIMTSLIRDDIEYMFSEIDYLESTLQEAVNKMGSINGIKYIQIFDPAGHIAATTKQGEGIGQKAEEDDLEILNKILKTGETIEIKKDKGDYFELERITPIKIGSKIINIIETEVKTGSKDAGDIKDSEKLLNLIAIGIEENAKSIIIAKTQNEGALQKATNSVIKLGYFHDVFIFDKNLNIIAATGDHYKNPGFDPDEYMDIRKDVLSGKIKEAVYNHKNHDDPNTKAKVIPVYIGNGKIAGLVETHILPDAFQYKIDALRLRMGLVMIVLVISLAGLLVYLIKKEVVNPITEYSDVAQKIASGDLNQNIKNTSDDEIGKFGKVFNLMVNNIRELDKLKSEFISVATHQLRSPLSVVRLAIETVLDGEAGQINDKQKNFLDQASKSNERMIQLVDDLLDISRLEAGKTEYEMVEGSLEELTENAVQEFHQIAKHKNILLNYHGPEKSLPDIKMNSLKLKMVIENLVDNAIKYTPNDGQVDVSVKGGKDHIEIIVADTGVGVPKDQIPKLFAKFFRASNALEKRIDGTGLGLYIAKKIIEKHNGHIWVESEEGNGTQMHFTIPKKQA